MNKIWYYIQVVKFINVREMQGNRYSMIKSKKRTFNEGRNEMKQRVIRIMACLMACLFFVETILINVQNPVYSGENGIAAQSQAVSWLLKQQNDDGSWGENMKLRDTSEILKYIDIKHFTNENNYDSALTWINEQNPLDNDSLFRIYFPDMQERDDIDTIVEKQNSDGFYSII